MSKKFSLEALLMRISVIPGLRFFRHWIREAYGLRTAINQRRGDLQHYYEAATGGVSDLRGAISNPVNLDPDIDPGSHQRDPAEGPGWDPNMLPPEGSPNQRVDAFSQNFEDDVFYDDG